MGTRRNIAIPEQHPNGLPAPLGPKERVWLKVFRTTALTKQGSRCIYCREPLTCATATADHVHPRIKGGPTAPENIKAACQPCNLTKGSMTENRFKQLIRAPAQDANLYLRLAHIRWRLWTRELQAEKRILAMVNQVA